MVRYRFPLLLLAVFFSFYSSVFYLSHSHAEILHGTPLDDFIYSTDIYEGICAYEGDDTILIETGSQIIGDNQQTVESFADADTIAVDAGSGDDTVRNNGTISANAAADALPANGAASQAASNAAGIDAWDGDDEIQNFTTIAATANSTSASVFCAVTIPTTR